MWMEPGQLCEELVIKQTPQRSITPFHPRPLPEYCQAPIREATDAITPIPPCSEAATRRQGPLVTRKQYKVVRIYEVWIQTDYICLSQQWHCTETPLDDDAADTCQHQTD